MANLIQKKDAKERALKVELPDGTSGQISIEDDKPKMDVMDASNMSGNIYKDGGKIKKDFEPHTMYKNGKSEKANTHAKHLSLSKKGYGHSKKESTAHSAIDKLIKQSK